MRTPTFFIYSSGFVAGVAAVYSANIVPAISVSALCVIFALAVDLHQLKRGHADTTTSSDHASNGGKR